MIKQELHQRSAIIYQSLYLMNLLLIPGIAFIILLWFLKKEKKQIGWHKAHLYRSIQLSLLAGLFIAVIPLLVIFISKQSEVSVIIMVIYFISVHTTFVMLGMLNIARAMAKKPPLF